MRKKTCRIDIRLSAEDMYFLRSKAKQSGLSASEFIRRAVRDTVVKEAPPADVPYLIREIRRVGINLNQLLKVAYSQNFIDVPALRKALEDNRAAEKLIAECYGDPRR